MTKSKIGKRMKANIVYMIDHHRYRPAILPIQFDPFTTGLRVIGIKKNNVKPKTLKNTCDSATLIKFN